MLSRTASELYWMSRHLERAENTARMLDVTQTMSLMPSIDADHSELLAPLTISGTHAGMAGTLSVASWTDRKMPPNIKPNAPIRNNTFQSLLRQPRCRNSSTPAQMSARNAGSSPNAAKNCPKLLSFPGYRKLEIWKS